MADFLRFALRIPTDLHEQLQALAKREGRSLHGQIIYMLRRALDAER
jgi:hypothetical protein